MMYQQPIVTSRPVQAVPVAVQPNQRNVAVIRGLSITQLILGVIALILGIVVTAITEHFWVRSSGSPIWIGIWMIATGLIGIIAVRQPTHNGWNGATMTFNIITTVATFFVGIFFAIAVGFYATCQNRQRYTSWYRYYDCEWDGYYLKEDSEKALPIYGILLVLMVVEWFVALITAIYCCTSCCSPSRPGVIYQQPAANMIVTSSTGQPMIVSNGQAMMVASSYTAYPPPYDFSNQPQVAAGGYPQASAGPNMTTQTSMTAPTYSADYSQNAPQPNAPPAYKE